MTMLLLGAALIIIGLDAIAFSWALATGDNVREAAEFTAAITILIMLCYVVLTGAYLVVTNLP